MIYYANKTLDEAQQNCTITEKKMLAVVFSVDKFRPYIVGSNVAVNIDHAVIKYLSPKRMPNQD